MKALIPVALVLLLAFVVSGCDFTVPLSESPKETADLRLVGLWGSLRPCFDLFGPLSFQV